MSRFIFSSLQEHDANELACEIVLSILSMPGIAEDLAALAYRIGFEPSETKLSDIPFALVWDHIQRIYCHSCGEHLQPRECLEPKMADTETQLQVTRILKEDQE